MAERTIMGVDFSGAQTRNATRFTMGGLNGDVLELEQRDPLPKTLPATHNKLKELIQGLPDDAVVALDFPFSVPRAFADALTDAKDKSRATQMSDLWGIVAGMEYHIFNELRDCFVKQNGEIMRRGDSNFDGPISPLKTGGPNMLPMTFYGMKMLHELWENSDYQIPPLPSAGRKGPKLLETMPGVVLRNLELPAVNYKKPNKSNGGDPQAVRRIILNGLQPQSGVSLGNFDDIKTQCINDPDQLDSLVAAVCAAMWVIGKWPFLTPRKSTTQTEEMDYAKIEGWIYAPKPKE